MDIFMRNIAPSVSTNQIKITLANIFHGPDYSHHSNKPFNFEVRIFKSQRGRGPPVGIISVPMEGVGLQFLQEYAGQSPEKSIVFGTRIQFSRSNKTIRSDTLETIRRLPYVDPRDMQEKEQTMNELASTAVSIKTVQFGWVCRDDVFSVEWEKHTIDASMEFVMDRREFRVKAFDPFGSEIRIIAIRAAQIYWTAASVDHPNTPAIFFYLNHPPSFESESATQSIAVLMAELSLGRMNVTVARQRWSSFDEEHAPIAQFTSLAIRLVCRSIRDLKTFKRFCDIAHSAVADTSYPLEYRGLFSISKREAYDSWVSGLPWIIAFQVEALARSHLIDLTELLNLRLEIDHMVADQGAQVTSAFLRDFLSQAKTVFWFGDGSQVSENSLQQLFHHSRQQFLSRPAAPIQPTSNDNFQCLHVIVTPTTMYLEGPFPDRSNRIMRTYEQNQDSFIRVSFVDETRLTYRFDREIDGRSFVNRRVKGLLINGLTIAGRHFEFLAYSQSALKEHAVWFVKPFLHSNNRRISASTIIESVGSFKNLRFDPNLMYCPARYAARISQAFTATDSSILVEADEVFQKEDIKDAMGTYCFTDGVGTISPELARAVWNELRAKRHRARRMKTYPRLFQVRFMGSKGMLSVDYKLSGRAIVLRPSMIKFEASDSRVIEIARAFDRPGKYYLNRPLIMILEGLGVPYEVFQTLQDDAVRDAQDAVQSLERSARLLEAYGLGASFRITSTMLSLHKLGLQPLIDDIFWQQMIDFAVNHVLRELKQHARIPLPDGWTLVGAADVHGYLNEGEIFACVQAPDQSEPIYLEGRTLISRSPTIHPGDVQVVRAIGRPPPGSPFEKESLRNGVIFSIKGERPLPSCLGGGDLDGDVYNVTTMPELYPKKTYEAANYEPAKRKTVDHPSTMEDVAEFVAEYINSDTLGIIAINWLIIADQSSKGILDLDCIKLAALHSDAVDYPKTGNPVALTQIPKLKFKAKPDWNAPETLTRETSDFYESTRAIGRLYRSIELPDLRIATKASRFQRRHLADGHNLTIEDILERFRSEEPHHDNYLQLTVAHRVSEFIPLPGEDCDEAVISSIWELFQYYASQLRTICADHTLSNSRSAMLTEEEAVVGTIVAKCSQPRKRKDMMSRLREQTASLVNGVRAEISGDDDVPAEESLQRAWIAYNIALIEDDYFGARSFAWVALGEVFDAIKDIEEEDRRLLR